MGLAAVDDPATEAAEVADGRDEYTPPVIAEGLMHKGTGLDCLACLHFAQPLNHTGRQDRYGHIWTGYAVFFLLSSHFKDLYLPAFPTY